MKRQAPPKGYRLSSLRALLWGFLSFGVFVAACGNPTVVQIGQPPNRVFIFGLGYTGLALGQAIKNEFPSCKVSGTCRSFEKAENLRRFGFDMHLFDPDDSYEGLDAEGRIALNTASHILTTIPPVADFDRDPVLVFHKDDILKSNGKITLQSVATVWTGYISTTGVYGNHNGDWVSEESPTLVAKGSKAHHRLAAEDAWLDLRRREEEHNPSSEEGNDHYDSSKQKKKVNSHVFRLAGIYGPGRSALETERKSLASGAAAAVTGTDNSGGAVGGVVVDKEEESFVSRIHIADICRVVIASMQRPSENRDGAIYNVADDEPAPRSVVMRFASELLGAPLGSVVDSGVSSSVPPLNDCVQPTTPSERVQRRATDNKRVSNRRIKDDLGVQLLYPTYKEGLAALHRGDITPFNE